MVYTICADGADKPMSFGFSFDIEQDGSTVNANMSIAYRTLSALPTISAPEASEVTSLEELTGGAAML